MKIPQAFRFASEQDWPEFIVLGILALVGLVVRMTVRRFTHD